MIDLSTLSNILETQKLTDEQSEELQRVIYGLNDGKIIELANMPTKGDMAYTIFSTVGDYARIIPVKYLGCFRNYLSRNSNDFVLKFVFVDAASELMKKDIADFTVDDMCEVYIFNADEIGEKFFFNEVEVIKGFHSFCNLSDEHINTAKHCMLKKNSFIVYQSDETWEKLYKIGFAQVTIGENNMEFSLSPLGVKWLSVFSNTKIKI